LGLLQQRRSRRVLQRERYKIGDKNWIGTDLDVGLLQQRRSKRVLKRERYIKIGDKKQGIARGCCNERKKVIRCLGDKEQGTARVCCNIIMINVAGQGLKCLTFDNSITIIITYTN
jgi:hypothetical protein